MRSNTSMGGFSLFISRLKEVLTKDINLQLNLQRVVISLTFANSYPPFTSVPIVFQSLIFYFYYLPIIINLLTLYISNSTIRKNKHVICTKIELSINIRNTIVSFRRLGCIEINIDFQNLLAYHTKRLKYYHDHYER